MEKNICHFLSDQTFKNLPYKVATSFFYKNLPQQKSVVHRIYIEVYIYETRGDFFQLSPIVCLPAIFYTLAISDEAESLGFHPSFFIA